MKRIVALALSLLLCLSAMPAFAAWTYPTPDVTGAWAANADGDITVAFFDVIDAEGFRIYRGVDGGDLELYTIIPRDAVEEYDNLMHFVDDDTDYCSAYTYAVSAIVNDEAGERGAAKTYYNVAPLAALEPEETEDGILIPLPAFPIGCDVISLYRKVKGTNGLQSLLASFPVDTTETSYLDAAANLTENTEYCYFAIPTNSTYTSDGWYDEDACTCWWKQDLYPDCPEYLEVFNDYDSVYVRWAEVEDADSYNIYSFEDDELFLLATVEEAAEYWDSNVVDGGWYEYYVKSVKNGYESEEHTEVVGTVYQDVPALPTLQNTAEGILLSWEGKDDRDYLILRRTMGNEFEPIDETAGSTYLDENVEAGVEYVYTLASFMEDAYISAADEDGVSIVYGTAPKPEAPMEISAFSGPQGVQVDWSPVEGVDSYNVYRSAGEDEFTKVGNVVGKDFYVDKTAVSGTEYAYVICSVKDGVESNTSMLAPVIYLAAPKLLSVESTDMGVLFSWEAVAGAEWYQVMCMDDGTDYWEDVGYMKQDTVDGAVMYNRYDGLAEDGKTYYYSVIAVIGDINDGIHSHRPEPGLKITFKKPVRPEAPGNVHFVKAPDHVTVAWDAVDGVDYYNVYRCNQSEDYVTPVLIKEGVTGTSFDDNDVLNANQYLYGVKAVKSGLESASFKGTISTYYYDQPALNTPEATDTGILLTWDVKPNTYYQLWRRNEGTGWVAWGDRTNEGSYLDTQVVKGTKYLYTLQACISSGYYTSSYDEDGVAVTFGEEMIPPEAPEKLTLKNTAKGITASWTAVDGADAYNLYRYCENPDDLYMTLELYQENLTGTSFTDTAVEPGNGYYYGVHAVKNGLESTDFPVEALLRIEQPAAPTAANAASGVKLTWTSVPGAANYILYRKTGTGSWTKVTETDALTYTDTAVTSGTKYVYTLKANDGYFSVSSYDPEGTAITFVACPALPTLANTADGVKVTWKAVTGAAKYTLYRKTEGTSWKALTTTAALTYTDTTAEDGTEYIYTLRAKAADGALSTYKSAGASITYSAGLAQPALPKAAAVAKGVKLTWTSVSGAAKYIVYRKQAGTSYKAIATVSALTYTDTEVEGGTKYRYTIKAEAADGTRSTCDTTGRGFTYLTYPALPTLKNTADGIQVTWKAVTGAESYILYRKTADSSWKAITTTEELTYMDTEVEGGTEYFYTLKAKDSDGSTSTYKSAGASILRLAQPALPKVAAVAKGLKLTWTATEGAAKYIVYRKQAGTSWTAIATTDALTYTDTTVEGATKYRYTIKAEAADGTRSTCDTTGKGFTYLTYPALPTLTKTTKGVKVAWKAVEGAAKYVVYRKTADTSWKALTTTESLTFTDTTAVAGNEYFYTVKAKASDGSASTYKSAGKAIRY